jgi:hypothetical protein
VTKPKKKRANVFGGSKDEHRGTWCTPKDWADAVGPWDLDPFSNPRSHIVSTNACMLEDGGDGLDTYRFKTKGGVWRPGSWRSGDGHALCPKRGVADESTRVWVQPPYEIVTAALDHYGHTRFYFLLRFDPRTKWFHRLYRMAQLICVPRKIEFEPPPGVGDSANPLPHALYFANADDATEAVLRKSAAAWKTR